MLRTRDYVDTSSCVLPVAASGSQCCVRDHLDLYNVCLRTKSWSALALRVTTSSHLSLPKRSKLRAPGAIAGADAGLTAGTLRGRLAGQLAGRVGRLPRPAALPAQLYSACPQANQHGRMCTKARKKDQRDNQCTRK